MDYLWEKESAKPDALYVDCFAAIDDDYTEEFMGRLHHCVAINPQKSNAKSAVLLRKGQREALKRKWDDAAELFNSSLRMAKNGSSDLSRAYAARAKCFSNRNRFDNAALDVNLAIDSAPPVKVLRRSERLSLQTCYIESTCSIEFDPKLSFEPNRMFPCLANVLEVKQNVKFGRHIVAKSDINVGKMIVVSEQFARVVDSFHSKQAYCLTCNKTDTNLIPCKQCTRVMFCSHECRKMNDVHQLECGSIFHEITERNLKLAVQLVLIAIENFSSADALMEFVESVLGDPSKGLATDPFHPYGLLLRLTSHSHEDDNHLSYQAFEILMTIPLIQSWFHSTVKQRFLQHLLCHHLAIVRANAFVEYFGAGGNLQSSYIYDALSLFNHSCAPNAFYSTTNNVGYLLAVRPIKKGDQIFINYLGDLADDSKDKRDKTLNGNWGFSCECERCEPIIKRLDMKANDAKIMENVAYSYIEKHHDDYKLPYGCERRTYLSQQCGKILDEYGHIWSNLLEYVTKSFILSSTSHGDMF